LVALIQRGQDRTIAANGGPQAADDEAILPERVDAFDEILVFPGVRGGAVGDLRVREGFGDFIKQRTREGVLRNRRDDRGDIETLRRGRENPRIRAQIGYVDRLGVERHLGLMIDEDQAMILRAEKRAGGLGDRFDAHVGFLSTTYVFLETGE